MCCILNQDANTVCLRSSDQFYIVSYCMKWVNTSWTYCINPILHPQQSEKNITKTTFLFRPKSARV